MTAKKHIDKASARASDRLGIRKYRAAVRSRGAATGQAASGEVINDSVAGRSGPIAIRRYLPAGRPDRPQPAILFLHGGAWVAGDLESHDGLCRRMVAMTGLQLVAADYRRAPEHPFPAAFEDATDAHRMLLEQAASWDIDPARLIVMGDEAGGTLAASVAIHAREMCQPMPVAQILFCPITDLARHGATAGAEDTEFVRWLDLYMTQSDRTDWRASPLHIYSFASLPPAFIATGQADPFHDEALAFADRLYRAGVAVRAHQLPGRICDMMTDGGRQEDAAPILESSVQFLRAVLEDGGHHLVLEQPELATKLAADFLLGD